MWSNMEGALSLPVLIVPLMSVQFQDTEKGEKWYTFKVENWKWQPSPEIAESYDGTVHRVWKYTMADECLVPTPPPSFL